MKSTLSKLAGATIAISNLVSAEMKPGACPVHDQNKAAESFIKLSMAGLWFEYAWDAGFSQGYNYKCSTWIVLSDESDNGEGSYVIYNNMLFPAEVEGEDHD